MARGSNLRGQFKTKARLAVTSTFGFQLGNNHIAREANQKLYAELKTDGAYMYQVLSTIFSDATLLIVVA